MLCFFTCKKQIGTLLVTLYNVKNLILYPKELMLFSLEFLLLYSYSKGDGFQGASAKYQAHNPDLAISNTGHDHCWDRQTATTAQYWLSTVAHNLANATVSQ